MMSDDIPLPDLKRGDPGADMSQPVAGFPPSEGPVSAKTAADLEHVFDVPVNVSAVLGRTRIEVGDLMKLGPGTILELDRKVGEAIDIFVNDRLVARGEVVLVEERLGVTMTEIIKADR
jgi:flagellar motor switch protein FliN/FliY